MSYRDGFCPAWSWWIRGGERLGLGLEITRVLDPGATGHAPSVRLGLADVQRLVGEGRGIVESFRMAGMRLPAETWSLLESGEHTGRLGEAMAGVGEYLREQNRRRRELAGQLWYPALVVATGCVVMLVILLWVVPQMREISGSMGMGGQLPWITEHIGWLYGGLFGALAGGICLLLAAGWMLASLARSHAGWARRAEVAFAMLPGFGTYRHRRRESRIFRQVGTLLTGGVTLPRALEMAGGHGASLWEKAQLDDFRRRLVMGTAFADCLQQCRLVSADHRSLLLVGQESGRLDHYLQRLARDLDEQVAWQLRQAVRLLEPLFLLGLSMAIGGLLLAYLLPMVRMLEQLA